MALLIVPILLIAVVLYIAYPLLKEEEAKAEQGKQSSQRDLLLEQKVDVIANLKDIEMDYRMGKLSEEDYQALKLDFEGQAVGIFQKLESLGETGQTRKKKS